MNIAADLPWDIIIDILSRLPVRDLLRYRCVTKPWRSLIDSPDFIKKHLNHSLKSASNLGVGDYDHLRWISLDCPYLARKLDHPMERDGIELVGSCNGLLALRCYNKDVALWNPASNRYRKLPESEIEFEQRFLPWQEDYGFGYDPISDDYKLVRLTEAQGKHPFSFVSEVKVYSAKADSWKRIRDLPQYLCYKSGPGVLVGHALHWIMLRRLRSNKTELIVALDLATEQYLEVPKPDFEDSGFGLSAYVLGGSLCICVRFFESNRVDVWMMKEYGVKESWTKLFSIVPTDVTGPFSYVVPVAYLSTYGANEVLLNLWGKKFIRYDLDSGRVADVDIDFSLLHAPILAYVESLVGLDGDGQSGWKIGEQSKKKNEKNQNKKWLSFWAKDANRCYRQP